MKGSGMYWVVATSLVLLLVTVMAVMNFPFNWVFYVTVLGQAMILFMVYQVLKDPYSTRKTFEDFYEDHPSGDRH